MRWTNTDFPKRRQGKNLERLSGAEESLSIFGDFHYHSKQRSRWNRKQNFAAHEGWLGGFYRGRELWLLDGSDATSVSRG